MPHVLFWQRWSGSICDLSFSEHRQCELDRLYFVYVCVCVCMDARQHRDMHEHMANCMKSLDQCVLRAMKTGDSQIQRSEVPWSLVHWVHEHSDELTGSSNTPISTRPQKHRAVFFASPISGAYGGLIFHVDAIAALVEVGVVVVD